LWYTASNRIRDELVLEAQLDASEPHILIRREASQVRCGCISAMRYLISALGSMAAERAVGAAF
jgi:hypothetical protein